MKRFLYFSIALLLAVACKHNSDTKRVVITGIDTTKKAGDDFFMYANGIWYDTARIPPSQTGVGSYSFLNYPQRIRLQGILDSLAASQHPVGSLEQQVGDFYASGMDTVAINKRGYTPIIPLLTRIDAITDAGSLLKLVADEQKVGNASIIGFSVSPDNKQSTVNIAQFYQTGIGLPERDYYFKTDSSTRAIQQGYKNYLTRLFELTGAAPTTARNNATVVYDLEKQLATAHRTNIELRDVNANYNKLAVAALSKKQPVLNWTGLLTNLGVKADSVNVGQPAYYEKLNALLSSVSIPTWKIYLKAHALTNYATYLSKPFDEATFVYTKILTGQAVKKTRSEEMTQAVDGSLGDALAQIYVKKYFPEEAKRRMTALVDNLKKAFEARINKLDWMSDSTKARAKEKLHAFSEKIGYPSKWRDYSKVIVKRDAYFENRLSANKQDYLYNLAKVGQQVDRTEWLTTPPTVTAYNNPPLNEIVFPAGILQSPYFDMNADDALNYGGIGMVIGHEITHSFDDQGAQYDKVGNVTNWWTKADYAKFKAKTQQVIDQYNRFTVLDSVPIKGPLTVGENTADLAGVAIAYDAFKLTQQGKDTTKLDGFTPDQRFFISIARIWRVKTRDEFLRMYVNTNPHSPAKWRVNGPLMNFTPFYKAFNVREGDKMYKPEHERITVW
ncbi:MULTISPECIES: M13 family metallopeptidase [unclassified Spirosoma]|uniref:M13 family metallopeptidase n=1 Tax=unclassified Spirosoma TaxID=2621999 RepID=UPI00095B63DA|nr:MULTISPECIES: M13 family metallopeptidase [unclassified Spirosoma]MBN8825848.1 M13 family metallopeptidase [Spirosoma sp.]OJW70544.1 MAG: peptidase M13 [Spirosoma sp. 48-14]